MIPKAVCSLCGVDRQVKTHTRDGKPICYGCWPGYQREIKARQEARDRARHLAEWSGHPSQRGTRVPPRSVSTGKAAGAGGSSQAEAGAEGMRAASTTATASANDERFWTEDEYEDDRRGLLVALVGEEQARLHGLTPKREEDL